MIIMFPHVYGGPKLVPSVMPGDEAGWVTACRRQRLLRKVDIVWVELEDGATIVL